MKSPFFLTIAAALLLGSAPARADLYDIISYADQLLMQGVNGPRFVQMVDDRYWEVYPDARAHPGARGMGAYVQEMHARGLRGRELADAIHAEQAFRGIPYERPLPPGQAKKALEGKPMPPGQAKKYGVQTLPPGQAKKLGVPGGKPKDKAADFGKGGGNGNGKGKGKKK